MTTPGLPVIGTVPAQAYEAGRVRELGDMTEETARDAIEAPLFAAYGQMFPQWTALWNGFTSLQDFLHNLALAIGANPLANTIAGLFEGIGDFLGDLPTLRQIINQVIDILNGLIVTPINNAVQGIKDWFADLLNWRSTTSSNVDTIATNINNAMTGGVKTGSGIFAGVYDNLVDLFTRASDAEAKAADAQSTLQKLLNRDEAEQSGGASGGDDFNRPNSTDLGPNWAQFALGANPNARIEIENNATHITGAGTGQPEDTHLYGLWTGADKPVTDHVQTTMIATGRFGNLGEPLTGAIARWDGQFVGVNPRNAVLLTYGRSRTLSLVKYVEGVRTVMASREVTVNAGERLQMRCGTLSNPKQFQALVNGTIILDTTDVNTAMGAGFREVGMYYLIDSFFNVGVLPASLTDWSFSDIPGAGSISGNAFRVYRSSLSNIAVSASSQVPAGFFTQADIAPNLAPALTDLGRGVFVIPKSGWWDIEFKVDGQRSGTGQGVWVVDLRLYYGANLEFNTLIGKPTYVKTADSSSTYQIPGGLEARCRRYFPAGYKIAPGFGDDCDMTHVIAEASGSMVSFSAVLLS
ncbi:minor tail protein [Gordonia phage Cafasso]|uniref:Minor tail protein n=1 Tax=Gordonia phage Cafasso TaxID=2851095 RepID=A0AAE7SEW9_9CAUD|nr:minor tail protein [Gordonia phage Cafasso]